MDWSREIAAVAIGGAGGASARYVVSQAMHQWLGRGFPWGTLAVNVIGSFVLGVLYVLMLERWSTPPALRAGLLVGFLGAFTTFSTFSVDTVALLEQGAVARALANVLANVVVCIAVAWLGLTAFRHIATG